MIAPLPSLTIHAVPTLGLPRASKTRSKQKGNKDEKEEKHHKQNWLKDPDNYDDWEDESTEDEPTTAYQHHRWARTAPTDVSHTAQTNGSGRRYQFSRLMLVAWVTMRLSM